MASKSAMVNRPDVFEITQLPTGVSKISVETDSRVPNCATFTMYLEDHTLGNLIRMQLLKDENVIFASYRVPHPLENKMELRIQATEHSTPFTALYHALNGLSQQTNALSRNFRRQLHESTKKQPRNHKFSNR